MKEPVREDDRALEQILIRSFELRDYLGAIAVADAIFPEYPGSEAEWRHQDAGYDGDRLKMERIVAEDGTGRIVGFAEYHHTRDTYDPRRFRIEIYVHPDLQNRGIGRQLYKELTERLARYDPLVISVVVRETFPAALAFFARRGLQELRRAWEFRLDVTGFDPAPFQERAAAALRGRDLFTVAQAREHDPDWLRKLFDLHIDVLTDVPRSESFTPPTLAEFEQQHLGRPDYVPDAHVIARDGGVYVAESNLFRNQELSAVLNQGITGTRRRYRRQGLALALKLWTIDYARRAGKREIRTWNDSLNDPMIRLNVTFGFTPSPGWITLQKTWT